MWKVRKVIKINFKMLLIQGYAILAIAIILNILAAKFNVNTWFNFVNQISRLGFLGAIKRQTLQSILFLFIIYPMSLAYSIKLLDLIQIL